MAPFEARDRRPRDIRGRREIRPGATRAGSGPRGSPSRTDGLPSSQRGARTFAAGHRPLIVGAARAGSPRSATAGRCEVGARMWRDAHPRNVAAGRPSGIAGGTAGSGRPRPAARTLASGLPPAPGRLTRPESSPTPALAFPRWTFGQIAAAAATPGGPADARPFEQMYDIDDDRPAGGRPVDDRCETGGQPRRSRGRPPRTTWTDRPQRGQPRPERGLSVETRETAETTRCCDASPTSTTTSCVFGLDSTPPSA